PPPRGAGAPVFNRRRRDPGRGGGAEPRPLVRPGDHGRRAGGIDHAQLLAGADPDPHLLGQPGMVSGLGRTRLAIAGPAGADHRARRHCAGRPHHPGVDDRGLGARLRHPSARQGPVTAAHPVARCAAPRADPGGDDPCPAHRLDPRRRRHGRGGLCPARPRNPADQVLGPARLSGGAGLPPDAGDGGDARHPHGRHPAGPDGPARAGDHDMIAPLRAFRQPQGGLAGCWLILVIAAALAAPLLTPYAYDVQNLPQAYQPASARHWLGTDEFGRDLLTRLIYGARTSLSVSATAISISVLCGMVLGAAAAWFGGWLDRAVTMVVDLSWSFPEILIALILVAIIGPGTTGVMIAIA